MIRFPNPGSDISSLIRIFQILYTYLNDRRGFTLDDMSATLTSMNLAASSGHVGERALALSTRVDRSRDPLYNQSKMYAELFRTLGWLVSDDSEKALFFRFTLLGDHAAAANVDPKAMFEECVLGINYPNHVLAIKGTEASRTFSTILKVADRLEDHICRDEIILGILSNDDVCEEDVNNIVSSLQQLRGSASRLRVALSDLSNKMGVQINTLQNYTRFPIAVLTYCGWFDKVRTRQYYPDTGPIVMFKLTEYGKRRANKLKGFYDVRLSSYETHDEEKQCALVRVGFFTMLQRANFDVSSTIEQITVDERTLRQVVADRPVLFSPYQTIRPELADAALGVTREEHTGVSGLKIADSNLPYASTQERQLITTIKLKQITQGAESARVSGSEIEAKVIALIKRGDNDDCVAGTVFSEYSSSGKEVFYPLVADLFTILGFNCQVSRAGNNYERWDAIAIDNQYSMPIEIKSPTEEYYISVKAVRQALENKVILLSRKSYSTDWNTATLAVGYQLPNERAEVTRLIANIRDTFGIRIGVIDFCSLLKLAITTIRGSGGDYISDIRDMEGLISVASI